MVSYFSRIILLLSAVIIPMVAVSGSAYAATCRNEFLGLPTWYKYVTLNNKCEIVPPAEEGQLVILILLGIFDMILYLAGLAAVVFVVWGGFKFLTSTGDPQKIAAARTTILNALVGLVIAIIASSLVGFIAGRLG